MIEAHSAADVMAEVADGTADAGISISVTHEAREPRGAAAFLTLAIGSTGQQVLREAGFLPIGAKLERADGHPAVPWPAPGTDP